MSNQKVPSACSVNMSKENGVQRINPHAVALAVYKYPDIGLEGIAEIVGVSYEDKDCQRALCETVATLEARGVLLRTTHCSDGGSISRWRVPF